MSMFSDSETEKKTRCSTSIRLPQLNPPSILLCNPTNCHTLKMSQELTAIKIFFRKYIIYHVCQCITQHAFRMNWISKHWLKAYIMQNIRKYKKNQTNILSNASFCIGSQTSGLIWYKICFKNLKQGQNIGQQCDRTKFGIELVFMEVWSVSHVFGIILCN